MKKPFYKTKAFKADHTTYGGLIYPSDFNTDYRRKVNANGSAIASRIILDKKFDRDLIKNRERNTETQSKENALFEKKRLTVL
ncbi:MAG: hypothetical protein HFJ06_10765 [Lachnospiraceae bacterium]|nr:hypothetical protein [Lachnospiraceae bacterium]